MGYAEEGKSINAQYIADLDRKIANWRAYRRVQRLKYMGMALCILGILICITQM